MKLADYWPTRKHVDECVRPEAENPAEAVFLAVHRPMRFLRRAFHDVNDESSRSEQELLDAFLETPPRGTLLLPILGDSGTGKSHMIRWLDIQLRRRADAATRHIIRIPKSSSLKRVLHLILESLRGDRYEAIRMQLQSAREHLDEIQASENLRANLLAAIRRRVDVAKQRISQARQRGNQPLHQDRLWEAHGDERYLPSLLSDPITSQLFLRRPGGTAGIIDEIARHLASEADANGPRRAQFTRDDFHVPDGLDTKEASEPARKYLAKVAFHAGAHADQAVELLNEVIDEAIAPLTNPGDTGLTELFVEIREQLLADGRELVLLVEDFAALAGIQGALFDAMNREGVRDGRQVACVMRTAIAVTRGYISRWETVSTRAVFGWELQDVPHDSDEETTSAICDLVSVYLNAARIGQSRLQELFEQRDPRVTLWLPRFNEDGDFDDGVEDTLGCFGSSRQDVPLFPFNQQAIGQIAGKRLRNPDGRLRFNPRDVINHLIRPVLIDYRDDFVQGRFPSASFLNFSVNEVDAALRQKISEEHPAKGLAERYAALIRFWGNDVRDARDLQLSEKLFTAFNLKPLARESSSSARGPEKENSNKPKVADSKPIDSRPEPQIASSAEPKEILDWIALFDKWSQGTQLGHNEANKLRKMIADGVTAWIDWDQLLLKPMELRHEQVFIPRARGGTGDAEKALITLCSDATMDNADHLLKIILALRSLVRFEHYKTWGYRDSAADFGYYANFMQRASSEAAEKLPARYASIAGDSVPALSQSLIFGARVLNLEGAHGTNDASLANAIFALAPPVDTSDASNWGKLRTGCGLTRSNARELLLRQVAARQGGAEKVHAIDAARVLPPTKQLKREGRVTASFPGERLTDPNDESVRRHVTELQRDNIQGWIEERRRELVEWRTRANNWLGLNFDKDAVAKTLFETVQEIQRLGLYPNGVATRDTLKANIEAFRVSALRECIGHIDRLDDCNDQGTILSAVAQVNDAHRISLVTLIENFDRFLKATQLNVETQLRIAGADLVEEGIRHVTSVFDEFVQLSQVLDAGEHA